MEAVVYTSNTGSTEHYAKLLGQPVALIFHLTFNPFEYPALTIIRRIISYETPYFCASCLIVF